MSQTPLFAELLLLGCYWPNLFVTLQETFIILVQETIMSHLKHTCIVWNSFLGVVSGSRWDSSTTGRSKYYILGKLTKIQEDCWNCWVGLSTKLIFCTGLNYWQGFVPCVCARECRKLSTNWGWISAARTGRLTSANPEVSYYTVDFQQSYTK